MGTENPIKKVISAGGISNPDTIQKAKAQGWTQSFSGDSPEVFLKKKSQQPMSDADKNTYLGRGRSSLLGG